MQLNYLKLACFLGTKVRRKSHNHWNNGTGTLLREPLGVFSCVFKLMNLFINLFTHKKSFVLNQILDIAWLFSLSKKFHAVFPNNLDCRLPPKKNLGRPRPRALRPCGARGGAQRWLFERLESDVSCRERFVWMKNGGTVSYSMVQ